MRLTLTLLVALGLAGCGGGDDDAVTPMPDGSSTAGTAPAPAPAPPSGGAQTYSGSLQAGDETLTSGEWADSYPVSVTAGQTVIVDATTDGTLDPYVILRAPSGAQVDNDDFEGSTSHARVEQVAAESGSYTAVVTSYASGQAGSYNVTVTVQ